MPDSDCNSMVSIGLPVYNRPCLLRLALQSLLNQSHRNIEIIVSLDCPPNQEVRSIVEKIMKQDSRIRLFNQKQNIGARLNHQFVLKQAKGEYFFWASEDDEWNEKFIETGLRALMADRYFDAWMCTIDNVDTFGHRIRTYPGFSRWTSTKSKWKDILTFIAEPAILGKPNIFHGVFRIDAVRNTLKDFPIKHTRANDISFVLAFLARYNLVSTDEILFHKRVSRDTDRECKVNPITIRNPYRYAIVHPNFFVENFRAVRETRYRHLVFFALIVIWPYMVKRKYLSLECLKQRTNRVLMHFGYRVVRVGKKGTS